MNAVDINTDVQALKSQLQQEHRSLKDELSAYDGRRYLTSREQVERRELQKRKLHVKDRIQILDRLS